MYLAFVRAGFDNCVFMWASFRVLTLCPLSVKSMQAYSDPNSAFARSAPRIFVVPKYATRPSYYGAGRIFFYALRTAMLLGYWFVWCVGLKMLLENLAPGERAIRPSPIARVSV